MSFTDFTPIAGESTWRPVMEAAGYRCQCTGGCKPEGAHTTNPGGRCKHEHKPWQHLLAAPVSPTGDPHKDATVELVAYCVPCFDGHKAQAVRAAKAARAEARSDIPLFDL